jgi:hypothetical protein
MQEHPEQKTPTARIGRCGELLVQFRLLKAGIESAAMTTDTGIDLVAYSPKVKQAITIQVKANLDAKPGGGKGHLALDWWLSQLSPAELVALVDVRSERVWLFKHAELLNASQQKPEGRMHFYMYVDPNYSPKHAGTHVREFERYLIDCRIKELFGI